MKKVLLSLLIMLTLCVRANHWIPDVYQYHNNKTAIGVIAFDDVEQRINEQSYSSLSLFPNPVNENSSLRQKLKLKKLDFMTYCEDYKTTRQQNNMVM